MNTHEPTAKEIDEGAIFTLTCHGASTQKILHFCKIFCPSVTRAEALDIIHATREMKAYI